MSPQNPFASDIFPDGFPVLPEQPSLHGEALAVLSARLNEVPAHAGLVLLLRAPRAGFGKSHLLEHWRKGIGEQAFVASLTYEPEKDLRWKSLFWELMDRLHRPLGANSDMTGLDFIARKVFARMNEGMIRENRIPCANPEAALTALRERSLELFDLTDASQVVAKWFLDHFERLLPTSNELLARETGLPVDHCSAWLRMLCAYAQSKLEGNAVRFEALRWSLHQSHGPSISAGGMSVAQAGTPGEAFYKEKVVEICRLAQLSRPLVLMWDHLDMLHGHGDIALRLAGMLAELRRLLPGVLMVVSTNEDLWAETFQKHLPSALEDRLSGGEITLTGLGRVEAECLLRLRLRQAEIDLAEGEAFLARLALPEIFAREAGRVLSARALLRHAARAWDQFLTEKRSGQAMVAPLEVSSAQPSPPEAPRSAGGPSFQQLREMLEKLRQQRQSGHPLLGARVVAPPHAPPVPNMAVVPEPPANRATPAALPQPPGKLNGHGDPGIFERFTQLRLQFLQQSTLDIDVDRLTHLIESGGKRLAVVKVGEVSLGVGLRAIQWLTPDGEVLFGTEPLEDLAYWRELVSSAARRAQTTPSRLVVCTSPQHPAPLSSWLAPNEIGNATQRFLDLLILENQSLATLYAAEELLTASAQGSVELSSDQILATLAPCLDPFWKRLTRPMPASVGKA